MKVISERFKEMSYNNKKEYFRSWVEIDGQVVEGFREWRLISELNFASTALTEATIILQGEKQLLDKEVKCFFGYKFDDEIEFLEFGPFKITEQNYDVKTDKTTVFAYDKMLEFCQVFDVEGLEYPTTTKDAVEFIGDKVGVDVNVENLDFIIEEDLYTGTGHEYRSFIEDVCEVENTIMYIDKSTLVNKTQTKTDILLNKSRMRNYSFTPQFGPVDSLVLSRYPQEDNVFSAIDADNINSEVKFYDNYLVDNVQVDDSRENNIDALFEKYKGMVVKPFAIETIGMGFIELGDVINVQLDDEAQELLVYGIKLTVSNYIKEEIFCNDPIKTNTKYQFATTSEKRAKNTSLKVDKQEGIIEGVVQNVSSINDDVNELSSRQTQTESSIEQEIIDREQMGEQILKETSSLVQQTNDAWQIIFSKIESNQDLNNEELEQFKTYFRWDEHGAVIGRSDSPVQFFQTNEMIGFRENDVVIAQWEKGTMSVDNLIAQVSIVIGTHLVEKYESPNYALGITSLVRKVDV